MAADESIVKYAPHFIFTAVTGLFVWIIKRYAMKVDELTQSAATRKDIAEVETRATKKLIEVERRFQSEMERMREEANDRYDRLEGRVDGGFRGIHERLDRFVDGRHRGS